MLEKELSLGFIGFGEAAFGITMGLKSEGFEHITAYDRAYKQPPQSKIITERAKTVAIEHLGENCYHEFMSIDRSELKR